MGLLGATLQPYGSFVSNLFTRWGDLDLSVDLFSGSSILFTGKKQKQTLLGHLLRALRANGDSFCFTGFCLLLVKYFLHVMTLSDLHYHAKNRWMVQTAICYACSSSHSESCERPPENFL